MSAQMINLGVSLGAMQLARKIPFEDPQVLLYVRVAYVSVQLIVLGIYYYVSTKIKQKNDLTVLKYVEPKTPMNPDSGGLVTTTVREYDLQETSKALKAVLMGIGMMAFMHGYLKYTQPLFIQALMGLKGVYDSNEVSIHLLGKKADGDLKRPFKQPPGIFGATGPQTDAAAIKEAEAAEKIAKKDE
ncbi:hypothetical protein FRB96_004570 [Tulasnella sp. 330]|nr:hypothetical protein FRB96_004570 [Tulasnella sp. 330]KAG8885693.1 hypothetical protein FRB97_000136 [Tulasnella sp. 331]KAG8890856.1 hypothetical protein FRB98_004901 [Tulasnella sp. 332]